MQSQPVLATQPEVKLNSSHPDSQASELFVTASVCLPLIALFAALRLYAKLFVFKKWTWDDGMRLHRAMRLR